MAQKHCGKRAGFAERSGMRPADQLHHDDFLRCFLAQEGALRGFLRSLLFSHDEVHDVLQETAVVLWRKYEPGMTDEAFRRWAFGVARMEALAFRRDRARDRHRFGDAVHDLLEQAAMSRTAATDLRLEALEDCLRKLPADQQRLVDAAYSQGARIDELAASLGRTAMAVYKSLHRIRIALTICVNKAVVSHAKEVTQ
jgi:RNA polymerase sigma-70 factor (ECF subfamily)